MRVYGNSYRETERREIRKKRGEKKSTVSKQECLFNIIIITIVIMWEEDYCLCRE